MAGLVTVGVIASFGSVGGGGGASAVSLVVFAHPQNGSTGGDPPSAVDSTLCPSAGPVILDVQWNCVAVLNLTEVALILASIGIIAYVFRDSDRAELPDEAAEVPVTAEEWEAYRRARALGARRGPPEPPEGR
ncbi:MAG: hypothetical protein WB947_08670 [Thermoplasmata archaeon]